MGVKGQQSRQPTFRSNFSNLETSATLKMKLGSSKGDRQGRHSGGDHIDLEICIDVHESVEVDEGETMITESRRCSGHSFDCEKGILRTIHCTHDLNVHYLISSSLRNRSNFSKLVLKAPMLYFLSQEV